MRRNALFDLQYSMFGIFLGLKGLGVLRRLNKSQQQAEGIVLSSVVKRVHNAVF